MNNKILKKRLEKIFGPDEQSDEQMISMVEVVLMLAVSRRTVNKLVRDGHLNQYRFDVAKNKIFYKMGEVREIIAARDEEIEPLYVVLGTPEYEAAMPFESLRTNKEIFEYAEEVEAERIRAKKSLQIKQADTMVDVVAQ